MRLLLFFLFSAILTSSLPGQKVWYVRAGAAGANNGSSWQDAYSSLAPALQVAQSGDEVWVAAGVYKPPAANTPLVIKAGVALYGGFAGTETTAGERNPGVNITILSGDLNGDDISGVFNQNRTDNAVHVLVVEEGANPGDMAVIDGFTISGGQTLSGSSAPDLDRRGGGVLAKAKVIVRRCIFVDNSGETGGALAAVIPQASGIIVEDCLFEKNNTSLLSSGIYFRDLSGGATVNRCIFRNNKTIRGVLYAIGSTNVRIDSCQFLNNDAGSNPCAGVYTWQTTFSVRHSLFKGNRANDFSAMYNDGRSGVYPFLIEHCIFEGNVAVDSVNSSNVATGGAIFNATTTGIIRNCLFKGNVGHLGGAVYLSGKVPGRKNIFEDCIFEDNRVIPGANTSAARGGALYSFKGDYELYRCVFRRNSATTSGGHIHQADSTLYRIVGCRFEGGSATFGAATANYAAGTIGVYDSCFFQGNTAATSGGALSTAFMAHTIVENCVIEANSARFGGGLFVQNPNSRLTLRKTLVSGNNAQLYGGGINVSAGVPLTVEDCEFTLNEADIGGAIRFADDTSDLAVLTMRNTLFQVNFAQTQGAAIDISNAEVSLYNCLFYGNINSSASGAGGAIINNASGVPSRVKAINCTVVENVAPIGAGIAQWQDTSGKAVLQLMNCILYGNTGSDYEIEGGNPTVVSLGGNLCGDQTLAAVLNQTNDQIGLDPLFVDPNFFNFRLKAGSPCIDRGVAGAEVPITDLDGNPRDLLPDKGCYEFQIVGVRHVARQPTPLRLLPNPARESVRFEIEDEKAGWLSIRLLDMRGVEVRSWSVVKPDGLWTHMLELGALPAGAYRLIVSSSDKRYEGCLYKQ